MWPRGNRVIVVTEVKVHLDVRHVVMKLSTRDSIGSEKENRMGRIPERRTR